MSDNLRRYRAIRQALKQWYPGEPSGRLAQHLTSLAAFISGIVGSKSSQRPSIATKVPDRAKPDSRVKRLSRWLDNDAILEEVYLALITARATWALSGLPLGSPWWTERRWR